MCGGTRIFQAGQRLLRGLSPRVRGNHVQYSLAWRSARSIPACAGEPLTRLTRRRGPKVYPRVCGGTANVQRVRNNRDGLSPRVRGNPSRAHTTRKTDRSIPACAGEPLPLRIFRLLRSGLSPRVRGNRVGEFDRCQAERSIPACAGEPAGMPECGKESEVYPRVCGGTVRLPRAGTLRKGLSPRVRGNRAAMCETCGGYRSIPACAGEPLKQAWMRIISKVYPRVCGGTPARPGRCLVLRGLSPRVRGNLPIKNPDNVRVRSIPACAGEP